MTSGFVDLHAHSTASDGTMAPAEVARLAQEVGLAGWALTDHDTIGGVAEAAGESARLDIDFIAGIEISAEFPDPGTLHILGYGVNPDSPALRDLTKTLLEGRDNRNPRIVAKLQQIGVAITMEEVEREAGKDVNPASVVGRPHIAAILERKGYVSSIKEAFNKYLAPGGLAYFDKERLTPRRALEMIIESGGIPVLAHPVQLRLPEDGQLDRLVEELVGMGLQGVEVIHSDHQPADVEKCMALARRYNLLMTGGSDFHGAKKKGIHLGMANGYQVPKQYMDALSERLKVARATSP